MLENSVKNFLNNKDLIYVTYMKTDPSQKV